MNQHHWSPSAETLARQRNKAAAEAEAERLERRYGPRLDALPKTQRDALARRVLDPITSRLYATRGATGLARLLLLDALQSAETTGGTS